MKKDTLGIDFESYSDVDLKKVGTSRYARDPSTEVLMAAYSLNGGAVKQWIPVEGQTMPDELAEALVDPEVEKQAWNAAFELAILLDTLKVPRIDIRQWRCSMVLALTCSLPGSLEKCGPVVDLDPEFLKSAREGKRLMRKFSFPRKPTKRNPATRLHWHDDLAEWEQYLDYNRQDVVAEQAILRRIRRYSPPEHEWEMWHIDQEINRAGVPINLDMVRNAIRVYETVLAEFIAEMQEITGVDNPASSQQLLPWLQLEGYPFDDLKKGHIEMARRRVLDEIERSGNDLATIMENQSLLRVLELRQMVSRTSIKKFHAFERATDDDGYLRYTLQYAAAGRTWRWGGRTGQLQNVARPDPQFEKAPEVHARNVEHLSAQQLSLIYGKEQMFDLLASTIRPAIQAPPGYVLLDADLSAIENIILGWLSDCDKILSVFKENRDPYLSFGVHLFGRPYADLWAEYKAGDKRVRTISKPGTLGCFRGDTLVLTQRGWVPIMSVRFDDLVHDGVEWVAHDGVVCQGERSCINLSGVVITADHKIREGEDEWRMAGNFNARSWNRAIASARSLWSATSKTDRLLGRFTSASAIAEALSSVDGLASWNRIARSPDVRTARGGVLRSNELESEKNCSTDCRIDSTRSETAAGTRKTRVTPTTADVGSNVGSSARMISWRIASTFSALTERLRSTGKTMTATMNPETFGWPIAALTRGTCGSPIRSRKTDDGMRRPSFVDSSRHDTGRTAPLRERLGRVFRRMKSSPIRRDAGAHMVFDVLNAGPRSRFLVLSADGPFIAHNCGYLLGPGEEVLNERSGEIEATGLLGYAWNMGIRDFTLADSEKSVKVFRSTYTEVGDYWYGIDRAVRRCMRTGQPVEFGCVKLDMAGPFMRIRLPSGRYLHYCRPKIINARTPWGEMRMTPSYEGLNDRKQWVRITSHPGKWTENVTQSVARDVLALGIKLARAEGLDARLHVHDQQVVMIREDQADEGLKTLIECMSTPPDWGRDIPLKTAGFASPVWIKD